MSNNPDITTVLNNIPEGEPPVTITRGGSPTPEELLRATTGLNLGSPTPAPTTGKSRGGSKKKNAVSFLSPEEVAQLSGEGQKIDVERESAQRASARMDQLISQKQEGLQELLQDAVNAEEARSDRIATAMKDPDKRKEVLGGGPGGDPGAKVTYTKSFDEDDSVSRFNDNEVVRENLNSGDDDLTPSYTDEPEEEEKKPAEPDEENKNTRPRPTGDVEEDEKEYREWIRNMEVVKSTNEDETLLETVREKYVTVEAVANKNLGKSSILSDTAFLNSITKYKKDNFRTISVPLINSGFVANVVGTGAVDLTLLYANTDEGITATDYEISRMKIIFKCITGTQPKVDPNTLRNYIHFADYNLLAWAHLAATLDTIELVQECSECGRDFHIVANTRDLVINMKDLNEKAALIKEANTIDSLSLMAKDQKIRTTNGFIVIAGHPSYNDYIQHLSDIRNLSNRLDPTELNRLRQLQSVLAFIRNIRLPNGVTTNSLYQKFIALGLLNDNELDEVTKDINVMTEKIITLRFGIKNVTCPYCGKVHTDIRSESLADMLFFHIMVSRWMKDTESK